MTRDLKTQLEIGADVTGAVTGIANVKKSLDTLGPAAAKAGQDASSGLDGVGKGAGEGAAKIDAATRNIQASIQRQIAITEAGTRSGAEYYRVLANQRGANLDALKPYLDQLDAVTQKQRAAGAALAGTTAPLERVGVSAAQTAAALRGVPAQFTDIVTSLAAGQQPLTVFLQQGGQLKDTFGGAGPAAQALGGYIAGLINPFTVAAAAAGALGFAYFKGSQEADEFRKAVILSGNAVGATTGLLADQARAVAAVVGTQGQAAEAIAALAATGRVAYADLAQFGETSLRVQKATGQSVEETAKQYAALGRDPVEAIRKLNRESGLFNVTVLEQVKSLIEQGRATEAATLAQRTYDSEISSRAKGIADNVGLIERAWRGVAEATSKAIDGAKSIGRTRTVAEELAAVRKQIEDAEDDRQRRRSDGRGGGSFSAGEERALADLRQREEDLMRRQADILRGAAAQGELTRTQREGVEVEERLSKIRGDSASNTQKLAKALADYRADVEKLRRANPNSPSLAPELIAQDEAKIRERFADKRTGNGDAERLARAQLGLDIDTIRRAGAEVTDEYKRREQVLEALRSAGLVGDREYFAEKRSMLEGQAEAEARFLENQIDRLRRETATGDERLKNLDRIKGLEQQLAKVRADAANQGNVLTIQETEQARREGERLAKLTAGYQQAQAAAEAYLQTLRNQNDRAVASVGRGDVARDRNAGINQIEDRYAQQRLQLESDLRNGAFKGREADYQRDLDLINDYEAKATAAFIEGFDRRLEAQRDWANGARRATENYLTDQQDAAKQTEQLFSRSFAGAEDALVQFVRTGKLNFKSFADSIITELIRIQVRAKIAESVGGSGLFGSLFAGLGWLLGGGIAFDSGGIGITSGGNSLVGLGLGGGRAYGGGVNPYGINPVAELGEPEVLRTRRGTYLINGNEPGVVEPLNKAAAGASAGAKAPTWTIVNTGTPQKVVGQQEIAPGQMALITADAADAAAQRINADVNNPNSKFSRSLEARFQLQRKRA